MATTTRFYEIEAPQITVHVLTIDDFNVAAFRPEKWAHFNIISATEEKVVFSTQKRDERLKCPDCGRKHSISLKEDYGLARPIIEIQYTFKCEFCKFEKSFFRYREWGDSTRYVNVDQKLFDKIMKEVGQIE